MSAYDAYVTHPISMKYYGLSGHIGTEEEEAAKQPPLLTSSKRSFDIPPLPLNVALPSLSRSFQIGQKHSRNAAQCRFLLLLPLLLFRYCCVLLQSNGTPCKCWKCQHEQRGRPEQREHVVNPRSNYSKKKTRTNASDRKANTFVRGQRSPDGY